MVERTYAPLTLSLLRIRNEPSSRFSTSNFSVSILPMFLWNHWLVDDAAVAPALSPEKLMPAVPLLFSLLALYVAGYQVDAREGKSLKIERGGGRPDNFPSHAPSISGFIAHARTAGDLLCGRGFMVHFDPVVVAAECIGWAGMASTESSKIQLNVYDLSRGLAAQLSPAFLGK